MFLLSILPSVDLICQSDFQKIVLLVPVPPPCASWPRLRGRRLKSAPLAPIQTGLVVPVPAAAALKSSGFRLFRCPCCELDATYDTRWDWHSPRALALPSLLQLPQARVECVVRCKSRQHPRFRQEILIFFLPLPIPKAKIRPIVKNLDWELISDFCLSWLTDEGGFSHLISY